METDNVNTKRKATVRKVIRPQRSFFDIKSSINSLLSKITMEDVILIVILLLLIEEGIEDEFLILIIALLILTDT